MLKNAYQSEAFNFGFSEIFITKWWTKIKAPTNESKIQTWAINIELKSIPMCTTVQFYGKMFELILDIILINLLCWETLHTNEIKKKKEKKHKIMIMMDDGWLMLSTIVYYH